MSIVRSDRSLYPCADYLLRYGKAYGKGSCSKKGRKININDTEYQMDKSCSLRCTAFYRIGNPFVIPYMIFIFENILAVHNEKI